MFNNTFYYFDTEKIKLEKENKQLKEHIETLLIENIGLSEYNKVLLKENNEYKIQNNLLIQKLTDINKKIEKITLDETYHRKNIYDDWKNNIDCLFILFTEIIQRNEILLNENYDYISLEKNYNITKYDILFDQIKKMESKYRKSIYTSYNISFKFCEITKKEIYDRSNITQQYYKDVRKIFNMKNNIDFKLLNFYYTKMKNIIINYESFERHKIIRLYIELTENIFRINIINKKYNETIKLHSKLLKKIYSNEKNCRNKIWEIQQIELYDIIQKFMNPIFNNLVTKEKMERIKIICEQFYLHNSVKLQKHEIDDRIVLERQQKNECISIENNYMKNVYEHMINDNKFKTSKRFYILDDILLCKKCVSTKLFVCLNHLDDYFELMGQIDNYYCQNIIIAYIETGRFHYDNMLLKNIKNKKRLI